MADDLLEDYIRQYIRSQNVPHIDMAWQGGEPTLMGLEFFKRIVEIQQKYSQGKTILNALQTNGTLLNDEWGVFLAKNNFLVGISIDGPANIHDQYRVDKQQRPTFDAVMRGIETVKKHGVEFNTLTVVSKNNQDHAIEIYEFLKSIGSRYLQFIPLVERDPDTTARELGLDHALPPDENQRGGSRVTPWSVGAREFGVFLTNIFDRWVHNDVGRIFVQLFDIALSQLYQGRAGLCIFEETCGASLAIEHNGDLYSCDHYVYPKYKLGNIKETPLDELVNSPQQFQFGNDKRDTLPDYCRRCEVRYACNGDCPKHRFTVTPVGEAGLSYLCPAYKHFFTYTKPSMQTMANLLRVHRAPSDIMGILKESEAKGAAGLDTSEGGDG
jgi:uncharacterized protein